MKGVLLLGLVGAAIYGAILLSYDLLPRGSATNVLTGQSLGNPEERQLRSWGTDLPALASSSSQGSSLPLGKPATTTPSRVASLAVSQAQVQFNEAAYEPVEWDKVIFAAKAHGDASVSSPTLRFYQPGTALRVVGRQNGWVQITDPTSGERGWIFEQYLMPSDGPTTTQTAMATTPFGWRLSQRGPIPCQVQRSAQGRLDPQFGCHMQFDERGERRAERRGGFGLFFFGRFARAE